MKRLGLIGNPVDHSLSPEIFNAFFRHDHLSEWSYGLFPLEEIGELPELLLKYPDLLGFNVTIPFKKSVIPYLNELDETAKKTGAVNTVKVENQNGVYNLKGYNTDVYGFERSLKEFILDHKPGAIILGTGGASNAVATALEDLDISFQKVSRDAKKGIPYSELKNLMHEFNLIINTTPLGMGKLKEEMPPIPYQFITSEHYCMDLVYNPSETLFLKTCAAQGAHTANGLAMLQYQAEAAWRIFKG